MRIGRLITCGSIPLAMCLLAAPSWGANGVHACVAGQPTAASYTWNFQREANNIFSDVRADADQAAYHADVLQSFARIEDLEELSWQSNSEPLMDLKAEINDMSARLCRLESIRRVLDPGSGRSSIASPWISASWPITRRMPSFSATPISGSCGSRHTASMPTTFIARPPR